MWNKVIEYAPEESKAAIKAVVSDPVKLKEMESLHLDLIDCLERFGLKFDVNQFLNCTSRITVA